MRPRCRAGECDETARDYPVNPTAAVALLIIAALLAVIVRIDMALLNDLAATPDHRLLVLNRRGWAAAIIFTFPIGAILYLRFGKMR
jgi:hypothetical protein